LRYQFWRSRSEWDTFFKAKHANGENTWGIDGETGKVVDMNTYGLWESASVKVRTRCVVAAHLFSERMRFTSDPDAQDSDRSKIPLLLV
jgi:hypothetical protein